MIPLEIHNKGMRLIASSERASWLPYTYLISNPNFNQTDFPATHTFMHRDIWELFPLSPWG